MQVSIHRQLMRINLNALDLIMLAFPAILLSPVVCHLPRLPPCIYCTHKAFVSDGQLSVFIRVGQQSMTLAVVA